MFPETDTQAPRDARSDPALAPILEIVRETFSREALRETDPVFNQVRSVTQRNGRISVVLNQPVLRPVNEEFLNGTITVKSVEFGNFSFDLDRPNRRASNVEGISVNLTAFGTPYRLDVKALHLVSNEHGSQELKAEFANPLPPSVRRVLGMPDTFLVRIPANTEGLLPPRLSAVFTEAAASTRPSIGGLLASDALSEASRVAAFAESNPQWGRNLIQPILDELNNQSEPPPGQAARATDPRANQPGAHQPVDRTHPGARAAEGPDRPRQVVIQGINRDYTVHVPPSYNGTTPMPLVIVLHGAGQDGQDIARETGISQIADREGFIAIYPNSRTWAGRARWRTWDTDNGLLPPGADANDVAFLRKIIEEAEKEFKIDGRRIYITGVSNGGMLAFRAAGELSDKVAAVAVVSGAMSGAEPSPTLSVSVLNIHGTTDSIIPYAGLQNVPSSLTAIGLPRFKSVDYATRYWVEQNRITDPPIVLRNGDVTERRHINATTGAEVNEYTIAGGGHVPDNIPDLSNTIWQFFRAHPKPTGTASGTAQTERIEPFSLTDRINAHLQTRGVRGLEHDVAEMLNEVHNLRDGSISPATMLSQFQQSTGIEFSDGITNFLKQTDVVSKQRQRITIGLQSPQLIPLASRTEGPVTLNSVRVDNPSFDLLTSSGRPQLTDIRGITVNLSALGADYSSAVREAGQRLDTNGIPYYRLRMDNPVPWLLRRVMLANDSIPVSIQLDSGASPYIMNHSEIKDATLGFNPVSRGYIDGIHHLANLVDSPSIGRGLDTGKDLGLIAGLGYLGRMAGRWKFGGRGGKVGLAVGALMLAPAAIHGIERLREAW